MPKKKTIIIYPHLNDCNGDLSKEWYVEWKWRMPGEENQKKERAYKGMRKGPKQDRLKAANQVIKKITKWFDSGEYLNGNAKKVYADELHYRHEAKKYAEACEQIITTRTNLSEYLTIMKQKVNAKTYQDYQSKLRIFNAWLKSKKLDELNIKNITRLHIIDFSVYLSSEHGLSKLTIKKYMQIIHSFFNFELDRNNIPSNPAERIPAMGKVVDFAATPFQKDDRLRLKAAIERKDPQLWLACEVQYYCAIRPGTELRLMKIGWIDFDQRKFRIPSPEAKNSHVDLVDIPDFLYNKIEDLKKYDSSLYVFGQFGIPNVHPVGKNTLRNRFNRYRDDLGISPDRKFYSWKHTGAIQLLENGMQPHDLQGHLRHKSFSTTEVYLRKRVGNLGKKVTKFSTEI